MVSGIRENTLQWISVALKKYGSCGFRTELGKRVVQSIAVPFENSVMRVLRKFAYSA